MNTPYILVQIEIVNIKGETPLYVHSYQNLKNKVSRFKIGLYRHFKRKHTKKKSKPFNAHYFPTNYFEHNILMRRVKRNSKI